jgi:hypothetical protein
MCLPWLLCASLHWQARATLRFSVLRITVRSCPPRFICLIQNPRRPLAYSPARTRTRRELRRGARHHEADDCLRVAPQRLANRGVQPAPRGSLVDIALEIDLHSVRHSYATAGRDAKIDWKALSQRIGHTSVAFTMKQYLQTDLEADRQVTNTLAELIIGGSLWTPPRSRPRTRAPRPMATPTRGPLRVRNGPLTLVAGGERI